ncbi:AAA family ATPase [Thomasclavelia sp.]|uniref:AAA family ATPase n=1 Tax=Thomasclavelia sp. TaxID=3025757 RepID=UPI0025D711E4|nr:AAA family ATPase [Thomasclavelia sp.]
MKRVSTGVENFKELIDYNYYYVDKTMLIADVLSDKVMLYTRPRRFGKTLNMSMLYYFFSNKEKENAYLFDRLKISENKEITKHQNQYPVIFLTLKDMTATNFEEQKKQFADLIKILILENKELINSPSVDEADKKVFNDFKFSQADDLQLRNSLKTLSRCLYQHYHQKVIILIDEYDVPLQSAFNHGYYDEMVNFLKSVFSAGLKTNDALERGILTGCLRIAKESIFTGLNNFTVRTITSQFASDCFGFTQKEIDGLLNYYNLISKRDEMKEWYDGYLFDNKEIYNPWSALNYIKELNGNNDFPAISFWANTSSNDLVRQYIKNGTLKMKEEFEELINGKSIIKKVTPELTYREMDFKTPGKMNDDIYSFLLYTGYLKIKDKVYDPESKELVQNTYELIIPNKEVKYIYEDIFMKWFEGYQKEREGSFVEALIDGNVSLANRLLQDVLIQSISYYDNYESFYHGFMVGFLNADGYDVRSNRESGDGRFDLAMLPYSILETAIVIECKHSNSIKELRKDSAKASEQIINQKYIEGLEDEGYENVIGYGISFYKKQCIITKA